MSALARMSARPPFAHHDGRYAATVQRAAEAADLERQENALQRETAKAAETREQHTNLEKRIATNRAAAAVKGAASMRERRKRQVALADGSSLVVEEWMLGDDRSQWSQVTARPPSPSLL